jgi:predicted nucleotidyltransferase
MNNEMSAFVTGSRFYGTPKWDSDVDLVVYMDRPSAIVLLQVLKESKLEVTQGSCETTNESTSVKISGLNLILVHSEAEYTKWLRSRGILKAIKPVKKETAIAIHDVFRGIIHTEGFPC